MTKNKKLFLLIIFLILLNFFSWRIILSLGEESSEIIFFDVGQGDSVFIKTSCGYRILIDGGPGDNILEPLAKELSAFDSVIDLMILTHPHDDHVSGLLEVAERYEVQNIICTGVKDDTHIYGKWRELIEERGYIRAQAGQKIYTGKFSINILYPFENLEGVYMNDVNEASIVLQVSFEEESFLLTGDAYKAQEKEIILAKKNCQGEWCKFYDINSDVLKVGHHGSRTSTSEKFLSIVDPEFAVIQAGEGNPYGHPHIEVLERLKSHDVSVLRTDKDGDIRFITAD